MLVELLNSGLEIGSSLVLDETLATSAGSVTLTVDLTVDDVKTGLAREIFQILHIELAGKIKPEEEMLEAKASLKALLAKQMRARYVPASWSRTEGR